MKKFYMILLNDGEDRLKTEIKSYGFNFCIEDVADEYHTMSELYDHRRALTAALLNVINEHGYFGSRHGWPFKSKSHSDNTMFEGYFICGIYRLKENSNERVCYLSYHYDLKYWDQFKLPVLERAPEYDGHTSQDVIERLLKL